MFRAFIFFHVGLLIAAKGNLFENLTSNSDNDENAHFINEFWENYYQDKFRYFSESSRLKSKSDARDMFYFGYESYMKYAFPQDELNPINCSGRGPDVMNPENLNINDVLGNFSLALIDSLGTLAIMGNSSEFQSAVQSVIDIVSFDVNSTVQVFETNIRVLGSLLSAHLIIIDPLQPFGDMRPLNYDNELLTLAHDLAVRLMPAFEKTKHGIPFPRVNLKYGVPNDTITNTATAGAGSLLLEFGTLSRLVNDPMFENVARRSVHEIWRRRNKDTGLLGLAIDVNTGKWVGRQSGVGAGIDSFFEYLLKAYILFGEPEDLEMFKEAWESIKVHLRRGREHCNRGSGDPPMFVNVDLLNGNMINTWVDSLQAFFPGLLVLNGNIEEAICCHAMYFAIWQRYQALPERFNFYHKTPDVQFYPLRPELIESTYLLYRAANCQRPHYHVMLKYAGTVNQGNFAQYFDTATKNPFYLHVGREILDSLERHARTECGYASLHNVIDKTQEDRMESFFLSETSKYLYLLFDFENPLHTHDSLMMSLFTTEGHLLPIQPHKPWHEDFDYCYGETPNRNNSKTQSKCERVSREQTFSLPLRRNYLRQMNRLVGVT